MNTEGPCGKIYKLCCMNSLCKFIREIFKGGIVWIRKSCTTWYKRVVDHEERKNYVADEGNKVLFMMIYVLFNLCVLIYPLYKYIPVAKALGNPWIVIARCGGWLLNLNCALILFPTMRSVLNLAISLKLNYIAPLDKNLVFHRTIAYVIVAATFIHTLGHYMNYSCCAYLYDPDPTKNVPTNTAYTSWLAAWANKYGWTGHILTFIMLLMYSTATKSYRRSSNFTIFWYTHHLFVLFYAALLIHGRNFWLFLLPSGSLYILERILRLVRGSSPTIVKRCNFLKGDVLNLELEKPAFKYKAGQYCFINCPLISKTEWHPFTISSCPEQEYLTFHIRAVGDWTKALMATFKGNDKSGSVTIDKPLAPDGKTRLLRVDGPFGTSADYVFDYEYVMLAAAGIGVTPYSSLLRQIQHKVQNEKNMKIKKVYFYWINRDEGSFEWFSDLLIELETQNPHFFEIHTYLTGGLEAEKIRQIYSTSTEFLEKNQNVEVVCKVTHRYEAKSSDELDLDKGEFVVVTERDESGWWSGYNQTTKQSGLFPSNYVTILDQVTGMTESKNRHYGRPIWSDEFANVRKQIESVNVDYKGRPTCGVFFCGPPAVGGALKEQSAIESRVGQVYFDFYKENF